MTELKRAGRNFIAAETGTKCHEIGIYDCYYICMYTISLIKKKEKVKQISIFIPQLINHW